MDPGTRKSVPRLTGSPPQKKKVVLDLEPIKKKKTGINQERIKTNQALKSFPFLLPII